MFARGRQAELAYTPPSKVLWKIWKVFLPPPPLIRPHDIFIVIFGPSFWFPTFEFCYQVDSLVVFVQNILFCLISNLVLLVKYQFLYSI